MSAEPKHVFDYTEWDTGISKCRHPSHIAGYSATCWEASANKAGWVSPEEATAREAAARREALEEAADAWIEGEWHPVFFNRDADDLSPQGRVAKWLRDRAALARPEPQYDQANQDRAAAYLNAALAEPERDEEGGND